MLVEGRAIFYREKSWVVWALVVFCSIYSMTLAALLECYLAAIPFFGNTLLSDLLYATVLFGGLASAEGRWPILAGAVPA